MWRVTRFPALPGQGDIVEADEVFLGWKQILAYRDGILKDLATGKEILRGSLDGCSLSRDRCAVLQYNKCRIIGLYDGSTIDLPVSDVQQVSLLERDRVAVRTRTDVTIYDLTAKSVIKSWPIRCSQISAGFDHLLTLSAEGVVHCWGDGSRGQQGSGDLASSDDLVPVEALEEVSIAEIAAGGWHNTALSRRGLVYQWGWNQHCQVAGPLKAKQPSRQDKRHSKMQSVIASPTLQNIGDRRIVAIACGSRHSVTLDECGRIRTWGWNDYGQCDCGDPLSVQKPTEEAMPADDAETVYPPTDYAGIGDNIEADRDPSRRKKLGRTANFVCDNDAIEGQLVGKSKRQIRAAFWTTAVQHTIQEG